jgi:methylphosphotriester-DNA--protein-cysteine methyltransferase
MDIQFPKYDFKIKQDEHQSYIFDPVRKRYVTLTPEEWVRQHWLRYLVEEIQYPRSLIAVEMGFKSQHTGKAM